MPRVFVFACAFTFAYARALQRGWRVADIGCGNGVLATEAALMGAEVDAIDISPAMLGLADIYQAHERGHCIKGRRQRGSAAPSPST